MQGLQPKTDQGCGKSIYVLGKAVNQVTGRLNLLSPNRPSAPVTTTIENLRYVHAAVFHITTIGTGAIQKSL